MVKKGTLAAFGAGAAVEYLLDPADGRRRRQMILDMASARLRGSSREAERRARYAAGKATGVVAEATPPGRDSSELNDPALARKVESELFRPPDAPKGAVDVNVEAGVVVLRGALDSEERIEELVKRAEGIDGVAKVRSELYLGGEQPEEVRSK
jgi:hypothetical protein